MVKFLILKLHEVITPIIKFLITLVSSCTFIPEVSPWIVYPEFSQRMIQWRYNDSPDNASVVVCS
jgi:hypothetical protein